MNERIVLHLDMNAFFASVEQQSDPRLRGKPVFVCGNRHSRTIVATASYEARPFGVTTGMPLHEALRLCPHAILVEGNPSKYADTFRRVAQRMETYSPDLEIFSIDEAFLDLTRTAARFGGAMAVARNLQSFVRVELGLPCSIGVAPNKLLAKLASGLKKPNGLTAIQAGDVEPLLNDLPVGELCGIGRALQGYLQEIGVTTCGELARVPADWLMHRFGRCAGLGLARMARGLDEAPVVRADIAPPAKSMGHLHTLSRDTSDLEDVRAILLDLAEKVGRRLRAEQAAGRTITLTVRLRDFTTASHARTLDRFLDDGYDIYREALDMLDEVALPQPVRLVGVSVSGLAYGMRQRWWLPEVVARERLLAACDRLNDRFGEGTVSRAAARSDVGGARHYALKRVTARLD
jgi:DNA polymerase-4